LSSKLLTIYNATNVTIELVLPRIRPQYLKFTKHILLVTICIHGNHLRNENIYHWLDLHTGFRYVSHRVWNI